MKYTTAIAAAFVAGATASYAPAWSAGEGQGYGWAPSQSWVTEVKTAFTTYCPEATQITHGGTTYSVTEATTLTITGPVTVSYPVTVSTYTTCTACVTPSSAPAPPPVYSTPASPIPPPMTTAPAPPPVYTTPAPPPVYSVPHNATVVKPSGTAPASTTPSAPVYTGAAAALKAGSAGLAAVFGLVAYAL